MINVNFIFRLFTSNIQKVYFCILTLYILFELIYEFYFSLVYFLGFSECKKSSANSFISSQNVFLLLCCLFELASTSSRMLGVGEVVEQMSFFFFLPPDFQEVIIQSFTVKYGFIFFFNLVHKQPIRLNKFFIPSCVFLSWKYVVFCQMLFWCILK